MGITRRIWWLTKAGGFLGLLTVCAVYGWTYLWPNQRIASLDPADTIICLAAGLQSDGTMGHLTETRARRCVDVYNAGRAKKIAFTGGNSSHDAPATGQQMAELARSMGVPANAIVTEDRSESTLQNALFTLPVLENTRDVILITDSFHLPRAAVSFYWAGARDIQLFAAKPEVEWGDVPHALLWMEAIKIWANAIRAQVFSLIGVLGVPDEFRFWIVE